MSSIAASSFVSIPRITQLETDASNGHEKTADCHNNSADASPVVTIFVFLTG